MIEWWFYRTSMAFIAAVVSGLIFGHTTKWWHFPVAFLGVMLWDFVKPFVRVIICNYRKVPYNG